MFMYINYDRIVNLEQVSFIELIFAEIGGDIIYRWVFHTTSGEKVLSRQFTSLEESMNYYLNEIEKYTKEYNEIKKTLTKIENQLKTLKRG